MEGIFREITGPETVTFETVIVIKTELEEGDPIDDKMMSRVLKDVLPEHIPGLERHLDLEERWLKKIHLSVEGEDEDEEEEVPYHLRAYPVAQFWIDGISARILLFERKVLKVHFVATWSISPSFVWGR